MINESVPFSDIENELEVPITPLLRFKEFVFLCFIMFFGITGLNLCINKILQSENSDKIQNITIHKGDIAQVEFHSFIKD